MLALSIYQISRKMAISKPITLAGNRGLGLAHHDGGSPSACGVCGVLLGWVPWPGALVGWDATLRCVDRPGSHGKGENMIP